MNEQGFYRLVKKHILDKIKYFSYDRLESKVSSNGLPDLTYSYDGRHGFIEFKYEDVESIPTNPFKLSNPISTSQEAWLHDRGEKGGSCWVLIGTMDLIYLISWRSVPRINPLTNSGITWRDIGIESSRVISRMSILPYHFANALKGAM